jgi:hypothetical protein
MVLKLNKVQKVILVSLVVTSAVSWLLLSRQSDADNNNVMMRAMMLYDPVAMDSWNGCDDVSSYNTYGFAV